MESRPGRGLPRLPGMARGAAKRNVIVLLGYLLGLSALVGLLASVV